MTTLSLTFLLIVMLNFDCCSAVTFYFEWPSFVFFRKPFVIPPSTPSPELRQNLQSPGDGPYGPPYSIAEALVSENIVADKDDTLFWCPYESNNALSPKCSCRGPAKFPIISCINVTGQENLRHLMETKLPLKSFGRLLVTNSSLPDVEQHSLISDKEFAVISLTRTQTKSFNLTSIESSRFSLVRLEITHNLLTTFPFNHLTKFKFLSHLDLRYNDFKTIVDDAFGHNDQLRSIDLSHNKISYVGSNAFHSLPSIRDLDLSFNRLKIINNYAFSSLSPPSHSLTLDLSNNKIFFLANDSFTGLSPKELILDKNSLNRFPERHFRPLLNSMILQEDAVISVQGTNPLDNPLTIMREEASRELSCSSIILESFKPHFISSFLFFLSLCLPL